MSTTNSCPRLGRRGSSRIFLHPSSTRSLGTFLCLGMDGRLFDDFWGEVPRLLHRWRAPSLGVLSFQLFFVSSSFFFFFLDLISNLLFVISLQL